MVEIDSFVNMKRIFEQELPSKNAICKFCYSNEDDKCHENIESDFNEDNIEKYWTSGYYYKKNPDLLTEIYRTAKISNKVLEPNFQILSSLLEIAIEDFQVINKLLLIPNSNGFNPTFLEVCKNVAEKYQIDLLPENSVVRNLEQAKKTSEINMAQRSAYVEKLYSFDYSKIKTDDKLLIIDDLLDSGSTLGYFAKKIKNYFPTIRIFGFTWLRSSKL